MGNDNIKIAIASDHAGIDLKNKIIEFLEEKYTVKDFGTYDKQSCDYPVYAAKVAKAILNKEFDKGILICGTGIGMQIAANRFKGIRAVCAENSFSAKLSVEHNNSNVLTLGQRVIGEGLAKDIVTTWLNSVFLGERHERRVNMLDNLDKDNF